jgi:hypothetical protein
MSLLSYSGIELLGSLKYVKPEGRLQDGSHFADFQFWNGL